MEDLARQQTGLPASEPTSEPLSRELCATAMTHIYTSLTPILSTYGHIFQKMKFWQNLALYFAGSFHVYNKILWQSGRYSGSDPGVLAQQEHVASRRLQGPASE